MQEKMETNRTLEIIRNEIEGWLREYAEDSQFELGERYGYKRLLSFLSTLESEKPIIPDGLDEEVHRFFEECIEVHEVPLYGKVKEDVITADCYEITARHFAKWGAERQKEQDLAEMAQSKSPLSVAYANRCFENGKQAMKEQMMKEAVEGEVTYDILGYNNAVRAGVFNTDFKYGDKVRIIIVKEDEK